MLGTPGDVSDVFAGVMKGLEDLRRGPTKRIDRVEERAQQGQEKLRCEVDRLIMAVGTRKGVASSSARLQPELISSSLGLTSVLGTPGDVSDVFAGVMKSLKELRRDMTKRID